MNENPAADNRERHAPRSGHLGNAFFRYEELQLRVMGAIEAMGDVFILVVMDVLIVVVLCFCLPWRGKVGGYESEESRVRRQCFDEDLLG
jgi:hypothetical protein